MGFLSRGMGGALWAGWGALDLRHAWRELAGEWEVWAAGATGGSMAFKVKRLDKVKGMNAAQKSEA